MKFMQSVKSMLLVFSLFIVSIGHAAELDSKRVKESGIFKLKQPASTTFAAGQPSKEQLKELKEAGIEQVINLRTEGEINWDEKAFVESLGMQYHALPIAGAQGITLDNAQKLAAILKDVSGEGTIVHCGSSNRVGALMALDAYAKNGGDLEAAISEGKRWGLTKLEPFVRSQLTKQ